MKKGGFFIESIGKWARAESEKSFMRWKEIEAMG